MDTHNGILSAIKKDKAIEFAGKLIGLEIIILSKLGPSPKTKYHVFLSLVLPRFYIDPLNYLCVPDIKAEMKLKGTKKAAGEMGDREKGGSRRVESAF